MADSPNKLLYGIIELNNNTKEWCCNVIRNENSDAMPISFDGLLDEYDLPYDIICRSDDKYDRVINAFGSYDINTVREFIGDESVIKHLRAKNDWTIICNSLSYSISTLISDEYLKAIYDNNVSLGDLLTDDGINIICGNLMSMITRKNFMPKEEEFAKLFERDGSLDNYTAESLAGCYMLKLIFDNEKGNHAFDVIKGVFIHNGGMRHPFIKDLMVKDKMGKEAVSYSTSVKKGSPF